MVEELAHTIERELRLRRLPLGDNCPWLDEVVWPDYNGLSIANVPATVTRALGVDLPGAARPLDSRLVEPGVSAERVVVVMLDGFGYNLLQALRVEPDIAQMLADVIGGGALAPLTSVFPSTTVAALSSLWTGFAPSGHGVLGTRLLLREYGALVSALSLSPVASKGFQEMLDWGFEADSFLGVPGIAEVLAGAGIVTHLVILGGLAGSGLSHMLHRGVEHVHRIVSFVDLWALMDEVMEATKGTRCFIAVYWGALDSVSHYTGARSRRTLVEAREQTRRLHQFVQRWADDAGRTLFIALADHGHLDSRQGGDINVADHPDLAETFRMPFAAEPRARFLYLRDGMRAQAETYIHEQLGEWVLPLDPQAALKTGLFGNGVHHPETAARIGDLLAICREGATLRDPIERFIFTSTHGGLAADEMLVPFIARML